MDSAFGVDHGEISKIRIPRKVHPPAEALARKAAQRAQGARAGNAVRKGPGKLKKLGEKAVNTEISVSRVGRGVGSGIGTVGRKTNEVITRYPGVTGTAVLGGGGYALYRSGRKPKKVQGQA